MAKLYSVKHPRLEYGKADEAGKVIKKAKTYKEGDQIELDDEDAKPLLEVGAIEEAPAEGTKKK